MKVSKDVQFLGFTFTRIVEGKLKRMYPDRKWFPTVHQKKRKKLRAALEDILDRKAPGGIAKVQETLLPKIRGLCAYFKDSIPKSWVRAMDTWMRRRIRQIYWKQWKTREHRYQEIRKLYPQAPSIEEYAYSANSYWRMAKTPIIHKALSNEALLKKGWVWLAVFA